MTDKKKEGHGVSWTDGQMHQEHFMTDTKGQGMVSLYIVSLPSLTDSHNILLKTKYMYRNRKVE